MRFMKRLMHEKKKMIVSVTLCLKDEEVKGGFHNDRIN